MRVKSLAHKSVRTLAHPRITLDRNKQRLVAHRNRNERNLRYQEWLKLEKEVNQPKKNNLKISVLVPTYNTDIGHLQECIESVINQTYENWELCIVDDCSPDPRVFETLSRYSKKDKRIKVKRLDRNGHICVATNAAASMATGSYLALLDHDDILQNNALSEIASVIEKNPALDFVYTDEDKLDLKGKRTDPFFKPDLSLHFLKSCNYITHFSCVRKSLFEEVGGFRLGTEGAQDWDLIIRITEKTRQIQHIPQVLYSWRMSLTSTASNSDSKPYAYKNQRIVLRDHILRLGRSASVIASKYMGLWHVKCHIQASPLVSIVIPSKDSYQLIKQCLESIFEKTTYSHFEVVVVDTGTSEDSTMSLYDEYSNKFADRFRVVKQAGKFNFSNACNYGAKNSKGDYILFLNNDTKVKTPEWIENMLSIAQMEDTGAVGAKLLYGDGSFQHIGVHLSAKDIAIHTYLNMREETHPYVHIYASNIRECSVVTAACLLVNANKFWEVGGFDTKLRVTYNDVDLCLKLLKTGYSNVYTPYTELYHFESKSVGRIGTSDRNMDEYTEAKELMQERWSEVLSDEKFFRDPIS